MKAGLEQVDLVMKAKREEITEHMEGVVGAVDDEKVISDHLLSSEVRQSRSLANHKCQTWVATEDWLEFNRNSFANLFSLQGKMGEAVRLMSDRMSELESMYDDMQVLSSRLIS